MGKDLAQDGRLVRLRYSEGAGRTCTRGWRETLEWALLSSKAMPKSLKISLGMMGNQ